MKKFKYLDDCYECFPRTMRNSKYEITEANNSDLWVVIVAIVCLILFYVYDET